MTSTLKPIPFLLLFLTFLAATAAYSQTTASPTESAFLYCEIIGVRRNPIAYLDVTVDYGTPPTRSKKNQPSSAAPARKEDFDSMVEAMNYLSRDGWELLQTCTETLEGRSISHWVLRKKQDKQ
jgi:hypothetical protein